jgi:hypothetical protein
MFDEKATKARKARKGEDFSIRGGYKGEGN